MKKAKKVPAKRRSAGPTKAAPFRLEVGKTYETRDRKNRVQIVGASSFMGPEQPMHGFILTGYLSLPYWTPGGSYFVNVKKSAHDLVREVPAPKPPKKAGKK